MLYFLISATEWHGISLSYFHARRETQHVANISASDLRAPCLTRLENNCSVILIKLLISDYCLMTTD